MHTYTAVHKSRLHCSQSKNQAKILSLKNMGCHGKNEGRKKRPSQKY